jgi:hypothetical protein
MEDKPAGIYDFRSAVQVIDDASESAAAILDGIEQKGGFREQEESLRAFFGKVESVRAALESLPLKDGVPTRTPVTRMEREEFEAQITVLHSKMQIFVERHERVAHALRDMEDADRKRLDTLRHAREIFTHFVRKGRAERPARFFDRQG